MVVFSVFHMHWVLLFIVFVFPFTYIWWSRLWVLTLFMVRCTRYNIMWIGLSVTYGRSVVFSGYSGFLQQLNWPPQYNWNMAESGVKHPNPNPGHSTATGNRANCLPNCIFSLATLFSKMKMWKYRDRI